MLLKISVKVDDFLKKIKNYEMIYNSPILE